MQYFEFEQQEQKITGIYSLKIRYNQVHGYYIEVTKPNLHLIPDRLSSSSNIVGTERFTTQSLKQLEHEIHDARTEDDALEEEIYRTC